MKKTIAKPVKAVKKGAYTLEVSVNDVEYKGTGENMVDALSMFVASPVFPFSVKTRVLLKFSDGKKKGSQLYRALMARRIFKLISSKPSALEIQSRKMDARMA